MERTPSTVPRADYDAVCAERDQLLTLLHALPDISFVLDEHGLYVQVIGGANEALYVRGQSLIGHTLHDALPEPLADQCLKLVRTAIESGELQTIEYCLRAADVSLLPEDARRGEDAFAEQWFEGRILSLRSYEHSARVALWVAVNITPRKQLEHYWQEVAHTDSLTGVSNRQRLFERAHTEVERAHRHRHPLSLLELDFDHFKRLNDRHGHAAGDEALRRITQACREILRDSDLMARIGGEEFAILLPETDAHGAVDLATRILNTVREVRLPDFAPEVRPTVSIGCATLRDDDSFDQLMRRADEALYKAKANGRDQACPYP
ncbi:sensor domain-containing diguanylate cyclase [Thioalkalivibrio sp. AKL12]|uniref:sensor domain-containing diguanylate cyclase n=1 Tax=Thioalkalivibrio sp. AKL12 TaxID=1158159 RepID=UPI000375A5CB|nr:sensor domain-containing diguanylate cyclase [Thioalkalivibrio sp. AKL12]